MKKKYTTPEFELTKFDIEDIITMSGGDGNDYGTGEDYDNLFGTGE